MHRFWNSYGRSKVSLLTLTVFAAVVGLLAAACGGGSSSGGSTQNAQNLLRETFSSGHPLNSGSLSAELTISPTGSSIITKPVTLSFGGPFQSRGAGKLPQSDFAIAIAFQGHTGQLGILSTGTKGYVSLGDTAYTLPAASFKQLESGVSAVGGGGSSAGSSTLSSLGIHPARWLEDPRVVGTAQIGGVSTVHIHGTLALGPLLADVAKILAKASTVSSSAASLKSISPAEQARIRAEVTNASFDLWTGRADHTIRKLAVTATLPVTGTARSDLGGMTSATLSFQLGYSDVGQPQTINAPASSEPYSQFKTKIASVVEEIEELVVSDASSAGGSGGSTSSSGGLSSATSGDSAYSRCVTAAGGNVTKIQRCATLLNGG